MKANKISLIIVFILASSFFISCQKEDDARTRADEIEELENYLNENQIAQLPTWTGLYYLEIEEGTGSYPEYYPYMLIIQSQVLKELLLLQMMTWANPLFFLWETHTLFMA